MSEEGPLSLDIPAPGGRLRLAREARGLQLNQAAAALHLEPTVLRALEADDYQALGPRVFVQGYLRNYAALLNLPAAELLAEYERAQPDSNRTSNMVRVQERPMVGRPPMLRAWMLWLPLLVVMGALGVRELLRVPPVAVPQGLVLLEEGRFDAGEAPPLPGLPAAEDTGPLTAAEAAMGPANANANANANAEPASGRLALRFSERSWVEVSDRNGRLLYGEQPAGAERELRGEPPFQLTLGNAPGVEIWLDGEPWPLAEAERRSGNVLRLAIDPQSMRGDPQ